MDLLLLCYLLLYSLYFLSLLCSVKAGKLLPFENYLLYTARSTVQPGLQRFASNTSMSSTVSATSLTCTSCKQQGEAKDYTVLADNIGKANDYEYDGPSSANHLNAKTDDCSVTSCKTLTYPLNIGNTPRVPAKPGDPGFVAEFYNHSRLHYLSTWGAEFRVYVNELRAKGGNAYPGRDKLKNMLEMNSFECDAQYIAQQKPENVKANRVIMHIDMDCFFVSVGLRNRPDLIGKIKLTFDRVNIFIYSGRFKAAVVLRNAIPGSFDSPSNSTWLSSWSGRVSRPDQFTQPNQLDRNCILG